MRWSLVVLGGLALASPVRAQVAPGTRSAPARPPDDAPAQPRAETPPVVGGEFSALFTSLARPKVRDELGLSPGQIGLVERLDTLTRDVVRGRPSPDGEAMPSRPSVDLLAARLKGQETRRRLIAHAEAIALEGILAPEQANRWRKADGEKAEPLLTGRAGPPVSRSSDEKRSTPELVQALLHKSRSYNHAGRVFGVLLGTPGMAARIRLSQDQTVLIGRLDALTLDILRGWYARGLESRPPPRRSALAQRLWEGGDRIRDSLFAHAEAIALRGVATAEQSDRCLGVAWRLMGTRALLDPELASRLGLSRNQRRQLALLFKEREDTVDGFMRTEWDLRSSGHLVAGTPIQVDQIRIEARANIAATDDLIWEILTPAQRVALSRILGQDSVQPAATRSGGPRRIE